MEHANVFAAERPRLVALASGILDDVHEAEDIAQHAWLRFDAHADEVENPPAWLTTVTTRLCLDRLRARVPVAAIDADRPDPGADPADRMVQTEAIGRALRIVADALTPHERAAFVLHESFGFDHAAIGDALGRSPAATRKLVSRARAKVTARTADPVEPDWRVVDAFMDAARGGDLARLLELLAPEAMVEADAAAVRMGTPERIEGREAIAAFFDGSARAALPVFISGRPGAAWFLRGRAMVAFDFTTDGGRVRRIVLRAEPETLEDTERRGHGGRRVSRSHPPPPDRQRSEAALPAAREEEVP